MPMTNTFPDPKDASTSISETTSMQDSQETPSEQGPSISRDLGISAVTAALFLLLRIFAVSRWDWDTATAVAETVDFGSAPTVVLGTLFAEPELTAIVIMLLLPLMTLDFIWPQVDYARPGVSKFMSILVLGAVTITLMSTQRMWWLPVGAVFIAGIIVVVHLLWRHSIAHRGALHLLRSAGLIATLGILALAAIVSTPWTVLEEIETTTKTINGHVLETPSGYLKVLDIDTGELVIVMSSDVTSRQIQGD